MQIAYTIEELSPPGFCDFIVWTRQRLQFTKSDVLLYKLCFHYIEIVGK